MNLSDPGIARMLVSLLVVNLVAAFVLVILSFSLSASALNGLSYLEKWLNRVPKPKNEELNSWRGADDKVQPVNPVDSGSRGDLM